MYLSIFNSWLVCTGPLYHLKHAKYQNNKKTNLKEQGNNTLKWPKRKGGRLSSNLYTKDTHSNGSVPKKVSPSIPKKVSPSIPK